MSATPEAEVPSAWGKQLRPGPDGAVSGIRHPPAWPRIAQGPDPDPIPDSRRGIRLCGDAEMPGSAEGAGGLGRAVLRLAEHGDRLGERGQACDQQDRPE
jgi:hypothetical protein